VGGMAAGFVRGWGRVATAISKLSVVRTQDYVQLKQRLLKLADLSSSVSSNESSAKAKTAPASKSQGPNKLG
jgi:hypothetical protein